MNGQNGGDGGNGGSGGCITINLEDKDIDITNLFTIHVDGGMGGIGGLGGSGGEGGRGTAGSAMSNPSDLYGNNFWRYEDLCFTGMRGSDGLRGKDGLHGQDGSYKFIRRTAKEISDLQEPIDASSNHSMNLTPTSNASDFISIEQRQAQTEPLLQNRQDKITAPEFLKPGLCDKVNRCWPKVTKCCRVCSPAFTTVGIVVLGETECFFLGLSFIFFGLFWSLRLK